MGNNINNNQNNNQNNNLKNELSKANKIIEQQQSIINDNYRTTTIYYK